MSEAIREEKTDIEAIMAEVRRNVRRKKEAGIYTDADIEAVAALGVNAPLKEVSDRFAEQIKHLKKDYDFTKGFVIASHRPVYGPLIVAAKKAAAALLTRLAGPMWERQVSFNYRMVELAESMADEIARLKEENALLRGRIEKELKGGKD